MGKVTPIWKNDKREQLYKHLEAKLEKDLKQGRVTGWVTVLGFFAFLGAVFFGTLFLLSLIEPMVVSFISSQF